MNETTTTGKLLLELKEVSKTFVKDGAEFRVLEGVNLKIDEGEFVCILGPTGCGKSVTLQIVAGLLEQSSGRVILDGREERGPGPHKGDGVSGVRALAVAQRDRERRDRPRTQGSV